MTFISGPHQFYMEGKGQKKESSKMTSGILIHLKMEYIWGCKIQIYQGRKWELEEKN